MPEALVIVDFQNDFTPGGALAVPHGDEIAGRIEELLETGRFDLVVATRDWHPADHGSFNTQRPPGIWPPHCIQNTRGAELHDSLDRSQVDVVVDKGVDSWTEGYSGFQDTTLEQTLREHDVDKLTIVGLATDYCVRHTALDALRAGFDVTVDKQGIRGIDAEPGDTDRALREIEEHGGAVV